MASSLNDIDLLKELEKLEKLLQNGVESVSNRLKTFDINNWKNLDDLKKAIFLLDKETLINLLDIINFLMYFDKYSDEIYKKNKYSYIQKNIKDYNDLMESVDNKYYKLNANRGESNIEKDKDIVNNRNKIIQNYDKLKNEEKIKIINLAYFLSYYKICEITPYERDINVQYIQLLKNIKPYSSG